MESSIFTAKNKIQNMVKSCKPLLDETFDTIQKKSSLNAYITLMKDAAYQRADELDRKLASGHKTGKLFGVPISVKDNIAIEGVRMTCASNILRNYTAEETAVVVKRLIDEDAIIVGKVNMDEFAMGVASSYTAFGRVKNPINDEYVPGGSSGGSACSVKTRQCLASLGTDTGGSIRQPASYCGLVGYKPTCCSTSLRGVVPMAPSLDQVGALTNNVEDNALVNSVISEYGYGWAESQKLFSVKENNDIDAACKFLRGKRIAVARQFESEGNPLTRENMNNILCMLEEAGAEIVRFSLPELNSGLDIYKIISCIETYQCFRSFGNFGISGLTEDESIIFRAANIGAEVRRRVISGAFYAQNKKYYHSAINLRKIICEKMDDAYQNFDAIISPTSLTTAFRPEEMDGRNPDIERSDKLTVIANLTGRPAISVPCGYDANGLPLGVQFTGKIGMDGELFMLAGIYEFLSSLTK